MSYLVRVEHDGIAKDDPEKDAVCFFVAGKQVWLPRSQVTDYDNELLSLPKWLAEKEDLDYEEI